MAKRWYKFKLFLGKLFGKVYVAKICGHKTKLVADVEILGQKATYKLNKQDFDYCPQCLAKMAIRCAWCGEPILVDDPVTLYVPSENFQIPEHAAVYRSHPLEKKLIRLVGCLGSDCALTGADRAGFWVAPGKVKRVISPLEEILLTGEPKTCEDLKDISESRKFPEDRRN